METKKSAKANLEKRKIYFLELGLILALGLCFAAFEWSSPEINKTTLINSTNSEISETDYLPQALPEPPKEEKKQIILEKLLITEKDIIDELPEIEDPEIGINPILITQSNPVKFDAPEEKTDPIPVSRVPHKPIFPGGDAALLKFISENTKYPSLAKENNVSGKVFVYFVVGTDGKVCSVSVAKSVNPDLDKEAIRVISMLPDWTPGKKGEKPVPVSFIIPINFKLD